MGVYLGGKRTLQVPDRVVDGCRRNIEPIIFGAAQGHDLPDRDREVAVACVRSVSPSTTRIGPLLDALTANDQIDRFLASIMQLLVHLRIDSHAEHFGEHERDDPVAVHA